MNTLKAFHIRCQQQILDVCWWAHVSNAEVLQRSGLSTIGDILRHRHLSLFGHIARLDPGVSAHDALRLMVDTYEGRKPMASWRRPPGRPRNVWLNKVQEEANALLLSIYAVIWDRHGPRSGATVHSDYATTTTMLMTMTIVSKMKGKTNFSRNRDCWMFENHWRMV